MARPRASSKSAKSSKSTRRARRPENLASLSSEVLRLRLQALNLRITGSKSQLAKRLQAAINGTQPRQPEANGRVQKRKTKSNTVSPRKAVESMENSSKPDSDVVEDHDELASVSSLDLYEDLPQDNVPANSTDQHSAPFTAAQLATIRETVQLSVAEVLSQRPSFNEPPQPVQGLGAAYAGRTASSNPPGTQQALDKGTEDKILRGEYIDFALLLPDSITSPQVPELRVRFDDSGPGSTSNMSVVRKRKPAIDTFHKWVVAFTTYTIVLVTAFPRRALELFKYQQIISDAAAKFKGLSFLTYDEQFRRRAARDLTIDWGKLDIELWTVTFSGLAKPHCPSCSSPYHSLNDCPSAEHPSRQHTTSTNRNGPVCFRFNRASGCSSSSCSYPHVCKRCHATDHSVINCPRSFSRKQHHHRTHGSSTSDRGKR